CCESCLFTPRNPVAPLPTQGSPFRRVSPAAGIINSLFIHTNICHRLSPHPGLDVSACMTHVFEV
uniref:Uncharacterized protein n=1 Tax=Mesocestoides corti TaxID=53468 RepID=A0A5K3EJ67_MESCO